MPQGREADLEVPIVEVWIVEIATMKAPPTVGQFIHAHQLSLGHNRTKCHHLDEAIAEIFDRLFERRRYAANAQVGTTELQHPSRMVPAAFRDIFVTYQ